MICNACGKEFVSRRRDARYCSSGCRVKVCRVADKSSLEDNVTDRKDSLGIPCIKSDDFWVDSKGNRMCKTPGCKFIADRYRSEYCWKCEPSVFHTPRPLYNKPIADQQKEDV